MENKYKILVAENDVGCRIDVFLSELYSEYTRSHIQKLIETNNISINGRFRSKNYKLKINDEININFPSPENVDIIPQDGNISVVYEDDDVVVVNKPKGLVVHPSFGHSDNTLVNYLLYHCKGTLSGINGRIRPGIVHRIDKDTSGLLVVAKNDLAHINLAKQLKFHKVVREYHAVVHGVLKQDRGTIDFPIGRDKKDRKKMTVCFENSKTAITHFEVIERYKNFTYVKFNLETGRTHQIRVHSSHIGFPLSGDFVYGPKKTLKSLKGQCLHAKKLTFIHPRSDKIMTLNTDLPDYFLKFLKIIKNRSS